MKTEEKQAKVLKFYKVILFEIVLGLIWALIAGSEIINVHKPSNSEGQFILFVLSSVGIWLYIGETILFFILPVVVFIISDQAVFGNPLGFILAFISLSLAITRIFRRYQICKKYNSILPLIYSQIEESKAFPETTPIEDEQGIDNP